MKSIFFIGLVVVAIVAAQSHGHRDAAPPPKPLDFSRPIYSTRNTIICPVMRAYDSYDKLEDLFDGIWDVDTKIEALRCMVMTPGLQIAPARPFPGYDDLVKIEGGFVTRADRLTNEGGNN